MNERTPRFVKNDPSWLVSGLLLSFIFLALVLADSRPANALPFPAVKVRPLPAFARKYGMPCSSCHLGWPMLSPFGQAFKDNGYQMGNDRDAPIYQDPGYWPATFRITPTWHRESTNRVAVDDPANPGNSIEARITTDGFDWSGLDFHTGGTLAKNISFYVLPSSDNTGAFHFESVWARLDNLFGSSWFNIKMGKFELDNLLSEKRILTLTNVAGTYTNYHFQPLRESTYHFGIGDNQVGVEWMGHSKNDRTRVSVSLLNSNDGNPSFTTGNGSGSFLSGRAYDAYVAASHAFEVGSLGVQRVGGFAYFGETPTFPQYTQGGNPIVGDAIGNKGFYRAGFIGQWYLKKVDVTTMYFHGWDSAFLGSNTAANAALPAGAQAPTWNGGLFETHYAPSPQLLLINRYEMIRMSRQVFATDPSNFGNTDVLTFGYRYYPFISSRAGFAFHNEYAIEWQRGASAVTGSTLSTSSLLVGFDFAF
jgi:hypothetical protein